MSQLAFIVVLQDMSTLLTVLTQVSCLGGKLTRVVAAENRARIVARVPNRVEGHFANRIRNIVGVIELNEIEDDSVAESRAHAHVKVIQLG